jgi:hypothetical protein
MRQRAAPLTEALSGLLLLLAFPFPAKALETFALALPVQCQLSVTCFIQNYVDHDPSGQVRDFMCRGRTYDGTTGLISGFPIFKSSSAMSTCLRQRQAALLRSGMGSMTFPYARREKPPSLERNAATVSSSNMKAIGEASTVIWPAAVSGSKLAIAL